MQATTLVNIRVMALVVARALALVISRAMVLVIPRAMALVIPRAMALVTPRALALALPAIVAGCAAPQTDREESPEPEVTISGALAFREGITPPPGSVATVTVADFADDSASVVAAVSIQIENSRVMLPFELNVPLSRFDAGRQYVVRAGVSAPLNNARWTTDVGQIIDVDRDYVDVGVLLMTRSPDKARDPDLD